MTAPTGWADDPAFVGTLLGALDGNPIIQPVTAADLFATLPARPPAGTTCRTVAGGRDRRASRPPPSAPSASASPGWPPRRPPGGPRS